MDFRNMSEEAWQRGIEVNSIFCGNGELDGIGGSDPVKFRAGLLSGYCFWNPGSRSSEIVKP